MIQFNIPLVTGNEKKYLDQVIQRAAFCGDGQFTKLCNSWIETTTKTKKALLTTSCTHALEMAAILAGITSGDEVIMPSFSFVSTANPFVLCGAKIVFVDIRPDTMNIDETLIEAAITERTKAIIPVHYAGVSCDMDTIMQIATKHNLLVIEDAAQAINATYKGRALGSIGHMGCISFHETKNLQCGEGGAILLNDERFIERAEIIREKGTNRTKFLRGQIDKYTWVDLGSSYLPSELNAAFLFAQLEEADNIQTRRAQLWQRYQENLQELEIPGVFETPKVPSSCQHNAHIFYIKVKNLDQRQQLIKQLRENEIQSVFHYIPLHSSTAGAQYGRFQGKDIVTTRDSERLIRLPLHLSMTLDDIDTVCTHICDWFLAVGDIDG